MNEVTVKIGSGKTPSGGKSAYVDTGIPLIRSQNVNDDKVDFNDIVYIDELTDESMANSRVFTNDVLLNITGASIGRSAVYKGLDQANVNQHVCIVRPTDGYCPDFVQLNLASDSGQKQIESSQAGGGREGLNFQQIGKMHFSFPTLDEQKQIGGYFNALDNLITLHHRKAICTKNVRNNYILSIFLWERAVFMGKMILYHGSPNEMIHPIYGLGEDKHDYGRGFYLTANIELAKEWAVCRPDQSNGWVHKYELETDDLRILDFQQLNVLSWLAELMKHREASDSKRYRMLAAKFIEKYGIDTDGYDVIKGWRADASYFYIAKAFVRDEIDVDILEELLFLGDLGIQYCIKSEKGYANLHELESELLSVPFADFNDKYNERDIAARENMRKLIDSDANKVTKVFSTLI